MAKRKLSRQQKNRIQIAQHARSAEDQNMSGRVISHHGKQLLVELISGELIECRVRSNVEGLVCGDRVTVENTHGNDRRINALLERENLLRRIDGNGKTRSIAANVSRLIICLAVVPRPSIFLLDQYLLSAAQQQIPVSILLNKIDLIQGELTDPFDLMKTYAPMGYPVIKTSVRSGEGMEAFRNMLAHQVTVLSGVSGVGKSSLTQWLLPHTNIRTAGLSEASHEGKHTTRASHLYRLPEVTGELIDTPGVRGFGPFIDSDQPLANGFRDIHAYAGDCRFNNCLHHKEPGCAVVAAVEGKKIRDSRYQSYLKLLGNRDTGQPANPRNC